MAIPEVFPFASVSERSGARYPDWLRDLDARNGVYLIREHQSRVVVYVGESHSDRLYSTLTRHFQRWTDKYDTAGATYERDEVEVAIILVPKTHAQYLQNELICIFDPRDNRLICGALFDALAEADQDQAVYELPRGYDYDISMLIEGTLYEFTADEGVPF